MKYALMGAVLITLPGVIALIYSVIVGNDKLMYAAMFSVGLNMLPFVAAGFLMRGQGGGHGPDLEH